MTAQGRHSAAYLAIYNLQSNGINLSTADPEENAMHHCRTKLQCDVHIRPDFVTFSDWKEVRSF